jgi:hypothetical protein
VNYLNACNMPLLYMEPHASTRSCPRGGRPRSYPCCSACASCGACDLPRSPWPCRCVCFDVCVVVGGGRMSLRMITFVPHLELGGFGDSVGTILVSSPQPTSIPAGTMTHPCARCAVSLYARDTGAHSPFLALSMSHAGSPEVPVAAGWWHVMGLWFGERCPCLMLALQRWLVAGGM